MHMQPYCICICICKCNQGHKMTFLFILQKGVGRERERKLRERKKQFILLQSVETFITPSLKIELSRKFNIRQNYNYYHYTHTHTHKRANYRVDRKRSAVSGYKWKIEKTLEVIIARKAIYTSMNCSLNVDAVHVSQLCCISYTYSVRVTHIHQHQWLSSIRLRKQNQETSDIVVEHGEIERLLNARYTTSITYPVDKRSTHRCKSSFSRP